MASFLPNYSYAGVAMARVDPNDAPLLLALYCINADGLWVISNPKYSAMQEKLK
jgi:hypothetical protein